MARPGWRAALALAGGDGGLDLLSPHSSVRLELNTPDPVTRARVTRGPRVGVSAAAEAPLRFWLADEPTVSVYRSGGRVRAGRDRQT